MKGKAHLSIDMLPILVEQQTYFVAAVMEGKPELCRYRARPTSGRSSVATHPPANTCRLQYCCCSTVAYHSNKKATGADLSRPAPSTTTTPGG